MTKFSLSLIAQKENKLFYFCILLQEIKKNLFKSEFNFLLEILKSYQLKHLKMKMILQIF